MTDQPNAQPTPQDTSTPPAQEESKPIETAVKVKKPRRLSLRQERFAQEYVKNNGNATLATEIVYAPANKKTAQTMGSETLSNPIVVNRITEILNASGMDIEGLTSSLNKIKNEATRPIVIKDKVIDYPDTPTRLDAIKTGLKMHGVLEKTEGNTYNAQINITNLDTDSMSAMLNTMSTLTKRMGFLIEDGEIAQPIEGT